MCSRIRVKKLPGISNIHCLVLSGFLFIVARHFNEGVVNGLPKSCVVNFKSNFVGLAVLIFS